MARLTTVPDIGAYLREQRVASRLSLRQLAERAGMSNPYLSQIERGLRRPSAEILGALADALDLSAEALYVRAGILDAAPQRGAVEDAIAGDPALGERERRILLDLYALLTDRPADHPADPSDPADPREGAEEPAEEPAAPAEETPAVPDRVVGVVRAFPGRRTEIVPTAHLPDDPFGDPVRDPFGDTPTGSTAQPTEPATGRPTDQPDHHHR